MKHFTFTILLVLLIYVSAYSQTESSSFNATGSGYSTAYLTDYQCLGINPANLGWQWNNNHMNLGFFELAGNIYSEPLTKKQLLNDLYGNPVTLSQTGKEEAAKKFNNSLLFGNASFTDLGFSYQSEKFGGIAFSIREKFVWSSILNETAANFLYLGYNDPYFDSLVTTGGDTTGYATNPKYASELYNGTDQNMLLIREFNLGYGRKVVDKDNFKLYLGVGFKYLMGYGVTQYYQENSGSELIGVSALSPVFEVDYDTPTPSAITGNGYKKVGTGFGVDFGATFELMQSKMRIAVALTDLGSIKWDGNVYEGNNGRVWKIETAGIDNYNIFEQGKLIESDNYPGDGDEWIGIKEKKLSLPTALRGGMTYDINEKFDAGLDFYYPMKTEMPGSILAPMYGLGGKYKPTAWFELSLGVVGGGKVKTSIPLGVTFYPINESSTWEIGFATRDFISLFSNNNPNFSVAFGFLRFSFGQ